MEERCRVRLERRERCFYLEEKKINVRCQTLQGKDGWTESRTRRSIDSFGELDIVFSKNNGH